MSAPARRRVLRTATVLGTVVGCALLAASPALAHVTAQADQAEQGGYTVVTLRVPNESPTAGTIGLQVTIPTDQPITSVLTEPVPGWTATLTRTPLSPPLERNGRSYPDVVSTVTWTAQPGVRINPGEFTEFPLSLGPLPTGVDLLVLPTVQTYDDGQTVPWTDPPAPDGTEPASPAPTVALLPPAEGGGHGSAGAAGSHSAAAGDADEADEARDGEDTEDAGQVDTTARWLGGIGLLFGALGLGLGGGAVLRSRRSGGDRPTAGTPAGTADTDRTEVTT